MLPTAFDPKLKNSPPRHRSLSKEYDSKGDALISVNFQQQCWPFWFVRLWVAAPASFAVGIIVGWRPWTDGDFSIQPETVDERVEQPFALEMVA